MGVIISRTVFIGTDLNQSGKMEERTLNIYRSRQFLLRISRKRSSLVEPACLFKKNSKIYSSRVHEYTHAYQ